MVVLAYHFTNAGIGAHEHLAKTIHRIEVYTDEAQINVDLCYQFGQYSLTEMVIEPRINQYHHFYLSPQTQGKNGMLNYQFGLISPVRSTMKVPTIKIPIISSRTSIYKLRY